MFLHERKCMKGCSNKVMEMQVPWTVVCNRLNWAYCTDINQILQQHWNPRHTYFQFEPILGQTANWCIWFWWWLLTWTDMQRTGTFQVHRIPRNPLSDEFLMSKWTWLEGMLCSWQNLTDEPSSILYSSIVSHDGVHLTFLLALLINLEMIACDVDNQHSSAACCE